jgi:actin-like ATPase involved in cell morphogenesis
MPTSLEQRLNQSDRFGRIHMSPPKQEQIVAYSKRLVEQAKSVCEQARSTREAAVAAGERAKTLMRRIAEDSHLAAPRRDGRAI